MCVECVKVEYPDRGTVCLETGAYLSNFKQCAHCGKRDTINMVNRREDTDDSGEETTTYNHVCQYCDHVIAKHEHYFKVEDGYQEYEMSCLLCGTADDSHSVLPDDHRLEAQLY